MADANENFEKVSSTFNKCWPIYTIHMKYMGTKRKERIFQIKSSSPNSNFPKRHSIDFDMMNSGLKIFNSQENVYISSVLEKLCILKKF